MGLAIWIITAIAERLNRTETGRKITTVVAACVIACVMIIAIGLLTLTVMAALGYYS